MKANLEAKKDWPEEIPLAYGITCSLLLQNTSNWKWMAIVAIPFLLNCYNNLSKESFDHNDEEEVVYTRDHSKLAF